MASQAKCYQKPALFLKTPKSVAATNSGLVPPCHCSTRNARALLGVYSALVLFVSFLLFDLWFPSVSSFLSLPLCPQASVPSPGIVARLQLTPSLHPPNTPFGPGFPGSPFLIHPGPWLSGTPPMHPRNPTKLSVGAPSPFDLQQSHSCCLPGLHESPRHPNRPSQPHPLLMPLARELIPWVLYLALTVVALPCQLLALGWAGGPFLLVLVCLWWACRPALLLPHLLELPVSWFLTLQLFTDGFLPEDFCCELSARADPVNIKCKILSDFSVERKVIRGIVALFWEIKQVVIIKHGFNFTF
ncbi:hypothetical protein DSO57_1036980 [Entomophthora muscae]|uniref:Uncharacterized protein n=1 Tax=Entomophthora muscae TaxID=34485 RepID=A0ACC2SBT7_9FUNG|nr:hypothetical protein DSO57_1036980 [Entomophthora muscae]